MAGRTHFPFRREEVAFEEVSCDLCGSDDREFLGRSAADEATAVICRRCGLIFLSPRMTPQWYKRYYETEYRSLSGAPADADRVFEKGRMHGRALAEELRPYLPSRGLFVEVGSSAGGVLAGFRDVLEGIDVLGIEPSERESRYARAHGIPTRQAVIEDLAFKSGDIPLAECILSSQSLNHFLSPRAFFTWAGQTLKPSGRLAIEVKNFRQQARRSGRIANSIQIDHASMFTPETLAEYLRAAGFDITALYHDEGLSLREIRSRRVKGLPGYQIRAVAAKGGREPFTAATEAIDPRAYGKVRASLRPINIALHHYFRYRWWGELLSR